MNIQGFYQDELSQLPPGQAVNVYRLAPDGSAVYYCTSVAGAWLTPDPDDDDEYGFEPVDETGQPLKRRLKR